MGHWLDSIDSAADTNSTGSSPTRAPQRADPLLVVSSAQCRREIQIRPVGDPGNPVQGGYQMKELLLVAAVVGLATTGCAQSRLMGNRGCCEQSCQIPDSSCGCDSGCCDDSCCGGDTCCDDGCCGGGEVCGCGDTCCSDPGCRGRLFARRGWCDSCQACRGKGCDLCSRVAGNIASGFCPHSGGYPEAYNYNPSPPTGQTAYPYYTTRGPRDFLQANPPSIGPY